MDKDKNMGKVRHEEHRIDFRRDDFNNIYGFISLNKKPADPESVTVKMYGEEIFPNDFDITGMPIFSTEASLVLATKRRIISGNRMPHKMPESMKVEVSYREASYDFSLDEIDTLEGVKASLSDLNAFGELCRKRYLASIQLRKPLHCFVLFGRIMLDEHGYTRRINSLSDHKYSLTVLPEEVPEICTREEFDKIVTFFNSESTPAIPKSGDKCPCCGKLFTIESLKEDLGYLNGKIAHKECMHNYQYHKEIDSLIFGVIDSVYQGNVPFEILPNPAIYNKDAQHIPWFLVHTSSGDIVIGRKCGKISIEWQENFRPFDLAIFNNDSRVVKWFGGSPCFKQIARGEAPLDGKRGIIALTEKDAIAYLMKVQSTVLSRTGNEECVTVD
ncbi:MAG: hypothetical protein IJO08_03520 [Clostridia bacterium]|nr:hypothetical protein [Clostridia bacterium]